VSLRLAKARRYLRRIPRAAVQEFCEPIFNRGQLLTFAAAVIGLALILRTASPSERDAQATSWAIAIEAFAYATSFWAALSILRAPLLVLRAERAKGKWHGNRFIYHEPLLVEVIRCRATGKVEHYPFTCADAEADCFAYFSATLDPDVSNRASFAIGGLIIMGLMQIGAVHGTSGARLHGRRAIFSIRMLADTISTTARVYCRSFVIGEPDETDGQSGTLAFPSP
jgi:hypothetical protein